ncbi:MAG: hypothetical protein KDE46_29390 [Caldilineaceae bacterium]|nr:hypothetical protein [Caldilineaceae bacterium]
MNGRYLTLAGRIRQEISDVVDQAKPTGANWHQELLRQMTIEIPGIRPAVLSEENRNSLDEFRGFRHVVRNVYSYNLDPVRIGLLVTKLIVLSGGVHTELLTFTKFLEDISIES